MALAVLAIALAFSSAVSVQISIQSSYNCQESNSILMNL